MGRLWMARSVVVAPVGGLVRSGADNDLPAHFKLRDPIGVLPVIAAVAVAETIPHDSQLNRSRPAPAAASQPDREGEQHRGNRAPPSRPPPPAGRLLQARCKIHRQSPRSTARRRSLELPSAVSGAAANRERLAVAPIRAVQSMRFRSGIRVRVLVGFCSAHVLQIPTPRWHEIHPDRDGLGTLPGSSISCRPFQNPEQKQHKCRYDPISQTAKLAPILPRPGSER